MNEARLVLRPASAGDLGAINRLIGEAQEWLRAIGTDQWQTPWPGREERVRGAIEAGRTWTAWNGPELAATVTLSRDDHGVWPAEYRHDPAVYVARLVVSRSHARQDLGAQLLDWAGLRALREYEAGWMRVDLWTTNTRLHDYYRRQGFQSCGFFESTAGYPSAALFQKPTGALRSPTAPLFREAAPSG
jgi:GNAT superfamily N-acetyltransferase